MSDWLGILGAGRVPPTPSRNEDPAARAGVLVRESLKITLGPSAGGKSAGLPCKVRRSGLRMPTQPRSRNWCSNASARASKSKTCPMYHDRFIPLRKESYGACGRCVIAGGLVAPVG